MLDVLVLAIGYTVVIMSFKHILTSKEWIKMQVVLRANNLILVKLAGKYEIINNSIIMYSTPNFIQAITEFNHKLNEKSAWHYNNNAI